MSMLGRTVLCRATPASPERPATVVCDWGADAGSVSYSLNLQIHLDGLNDHRDASGFTLEECQRGLAWRTSVPRIGPNVLDGKYWPMSYGWRPLDDQAPAPAATTPSSP